MICDKTTGTEKRGTACPGGPDDFDYNDKMDTWTAKSSHGPQPKKDDDIKDDDMNPDMTPKEEDATEEDYRERMKRLNDLPPPSDPGDIRARNREKEEIERRLRELGDKKRKREKEATNGGTQ